MSTIVLDTENVLHTCLTFEFQAIPVSLFDSTYWLRSHGTHDLHPEHCVNISTMTVDVGVDYTLFVFAFN